MMNLCEHPIETLTPDDEHAHRQAERGEAGLGDVEDFAFGKAVSDDAAPGAEEEHRQHLERDHEAERGAGAPL